MQPGTVILLNGTSSAGKSTIALALRDLLDAPYLLTGIDHFLKQLPRQCIVYSDGLNPVAADGWLLVFRDGALAELPRIGPGGRRFLAGMYMAIGAFASQGNNAIVDDVIYDRQVLESAITAWHALPVYFVGVRCALAVAERREGERGDRAPGGARVFHEAVHAHAIYDFEVDSSETSPAECAQQIGDWLRRAPPPQAFRRMRERAMREERRSR